MNNNRILILAISIFLLCISIVITYMWKNNFTITETGTLGDGFNGLLAPFISFAGASLVYLSFRQQIDANKLQITANNLLASQWMEERNSHFFDEIQREYKAAFHNPIFNKDGTVTKVPTNIYLKSLICSEGEELTFRLNEFKKLQAIFIKLNFLLRRLKMMDREGQRLIWLKLDLFYAAQLSENIELFKNYYNANIYAKIPTIPTVDENLFFDINAEIIKFTAAYSTREVLIEN